ncbi:MAG TPA: 16S rRNA (cytidine(1402)-2'-O)-methyltransferase [Chlamydiales bacterium]|nr:16S rRNA (cytidine(1402)-2'-O)-methyltransferase [Chlamydiales bacterium]
MLYLIASPIGNLGDITLRALEILKKCDYILCEDTRRSRILLDHFGIQKPLKSFHKFSEKKEERGILGDLRQGMEIGLLSDAGTPTIADPGRDLIVRVIEEGLPFTALPGPCSLIQGLVLSGFPSERFQFLGFLSKKESEELKVLKSMLFFNGTSICYVPPNRLINTLECLEELSANANLGVARELTKIHEECVRGNPTTLISHFKNNPPKGEIVLLVEKGKIEEEEIPLEELLPLLQESFSLSLKEAIKMAAKLLGKPKKIIYNKTHR